MFSCVIRVGPIGLAINEVPKLFGKKIAPLGIAITLVAVVSVTANPNSAYAGTNPPVEVVKAKIARAFPNAPVVLAIADCESDFKQFEPNGSPLRNKKGSSATGVLQLMASYHRADALKMGYDIHTLEGNIAYARVLFKRYGTKPWNASRGCWKNKRASMDVEYSLDPDAPKLVGNDKVKVDDLF